MPCPCRVKVVADCTALRRGQWGNTYSRRGDPTITAYNGLGRRIRTRLVRFFSLLVLVEPSNTVQPRSRRGDLFSSLAKDLHRLRLRERERVSIAKGVEIKQRGDISYLCAQASEKQPNSPITLQRFGCLVGADRRIICFSRKREREREKKYLSTGNFFFLQFNKTSKQAHSLLPKVSPYNQLETQRPTIYHHHHQHHNERPTTTTTRRRTQQQQQHHHSSRSSHRPL